MFFPIIAIQLDFIKSIKSTIAAALKEHNLKIFKAPEFPLP